jgi:predicted dehydrogenase
VPVFVEKPMTADLASARALVATAGDRIFVMDKWRYHPGIETLGALARSGTYGALQGVETTRHQWGNIHRDVDVVWILAPHDLSIGVEILGHLPSPVSAVAERSQGQLSGLRATLGSGRPGDAEWLTLSVSSRSPVWNRGVLVHTDSAVLALHDSYDDHVAVYPSSGLTFGDPPPPERIPVSTEFPLRRELDAFLGHLAGGPPPKTSATDGLASIECIVALRSLAGIEPDAGDTP